MATPPNHKRTRKIIFTPTPERVFVNHFRVEPPPKLYHYTTQLGFYGIVTSRSVWATDIRYLNDFEEYVYAVDRAKSAISSVSRSTSLLGARALALSIKEALDKPRSDRFYVFSLCEDGDALNQWRSYTRPGPGYALGFATEWIRNLCDEGRLLFGKCIYSKKEAEEAISELASSYVADLGQYFPQFGHGEINEDLIAARSRKFVELFLNYAAFIKNPAFEQEREWRIVVASGSSTIRSAEFRSGPHSMVPYVTIGNEDVSFLGGLRDVVVKPTPHMELAEQAVYAFMQAQHRKAELPDYEIRKFEVRRSIVPYREGV